MADFIYMMESRLLPDQLRTINTLAEIARNHDMNVYLVGGAMRDILSGFPIRDLDVVVQGNALKLQKDIEKAGGVVHFVDETFRVLYVTMPGRIRVELSMARSETYEKPGKPPVVQASTINEDLRRRDFTMNAMALSLNPGSRGLLLDPFNGVADIEAKQIRVLHNYAFLEEPSRMMRALRFCTRFGWQLEERTKARFDSAKENDYLQYLTPRAAALEIEHIGVEDDPLPVMKAFEKEGWLKLLHSGWSVAKVDQAGVAETLKERSQLQDLGYQVDSSTILFHYLTCKLPEKDRKDMRKQIVHKFLMDDWERLDHESKDFAKKLTSKEAETPSVAYKMLEAAPKEIVLYLMLTTRSGAVDTKIKNWLTKWRQVRQRLPLAEMTELRITPELPNFNDIVREVMFQLMDNKLKTPEEAKAFLKPFSPPEPPPPPAPIRRGRKSAKKAAKVVEVVPEEEIEVPVGGDEDELDLGDESGDSDSDADDFDDDDEERPAKSAKAAKPVKAAKNGKPEKSAPEKVATVVKAAGKAVVAAVKTLAKGAPEKKVAAPAKAVAPAKAPARAPAKPAPAKAAAKKPAPKPPAKKAAPKPAVKKKAAAAGKKKR